MTMGIVSVAFLAAVTPYPRHLSRRLRLGGERRGEEAA
jgi:hypothetical protein